MAWTIEPLDASHDRAAFSCEEAGLTRYLQALTLQEPQRLLAGVFVACLPESKQVVGFYALSPFVIAREVLPADIRGAQGMPRYETYPAFLLGRLARDVTQKHTGLGEFLLVNALARALVHADDIGGIAVVVDTVSEHARRFYALYGFLPLSPESSRLFVTMADVRETLRGS